MRRIILLKENLKIITIPTLEGEPEEVTHKYIDEDTGLYTSFLHINRADSDFLWESIYKRFMFNYPNLVLYSDYFYSDSYKTDTFYMPLITS
jgi:hypothetical protein